MTNKQIIKDFETILIGLAFKLPAMSHLFIMNQWKDFRNYTIELQKENEELREQIEIISNNYKESQL